MNICQCGCGNEISEKNAAYKPRKFQTGHFRNSKGWGFAPVCKLNITSASTGRYRAKKIIVNRNRCQLSKTKQCRGRKEIHHIDKNPLNNRRSNLAVLCMSHHRMIELGRISFENPKMPKFYTDRRGKRRYQKSQAFEVTILRKK